MLDVTTFNFAVSQLTNALPLLSKTKYPLYGGRIVFNKCDKVI